MCRAEEEAVDLGGARLDRLLVADDIDPADLRARPAQRAAEAARRAAKNEQDVHLFERLAFMARRQQ